MVSNVMKHIGHKWGGNILSIHEGIGPPNRRPKQKMNFFLKTSQELQMLSSVTINCQVTKIVMNSDSQLSQL